MMLLFVVAPKMGWFSVLTCFCDVLFVVAHKV